MDLGSEVGGNVLVAYKVANRYAPYY